MGVVSGARAALASCGYDDAVLDHALVLEDVNGHRLETIHALLSPELVVEIVEQVMATVRELHEAGVVHGAVCSENILVCGPGRKEGWCRLADFRRAKFREDMMGPLEWVKERDKDLRGLRAFIQCAGRCGYASADVSLIGDITSDLDDPFGVCGGTRRNSLSSSLGPDVSFYC